MNTILKSIALFAFAMLFAGCPSDDDVVDTTVAYDVQYPLDLAKIEDFLQSHSVTIDAENNTTFTEIEAGGTELPIMEHPNLSFITVNKHDIAYKVYYLKLNDGDVSQMSPSKVDSVFVSYKGTSFAKKTETVNNVTTTYTEQTHFETVVNPLWLTLDNVILGWSEILPLIHPGLASVNPINGDITYSQLGSIVMFLPSGLAYYSQSRTGIPQYSPLIFNVKLVKQRSRDHDRDKILSRNEYVINPDFSILDSDGDGLADYLDADDDNDGYLTKDEIKISTGVYYDFANIPLCTGSNANGKKKHLDGSCH